MSGATVGGMARPTANTRSASTTWAYKRVKVRRPAGGQKPSGPQARRWALRAPRNPREPLTLTIKYRGGPEAWYEVHARGEIGRMPGVTSIHDLMEEINRGVDWYCRDPKGR